MKCHLSVKDFQCVDCGKKMSEATYMDIFHPQNKSIPDNIQI
jgi:NAD-dependent SIR2 family protein deacetylase